VVINFVIVAAAIFVLVRVVSRFDKKAAAPPPATKDCPQCRMAVPLAATKCGHCTSAITA
jgi:large conductance mechanosensitive channel